MHCQAEARTAQLFAPPGFGADGPPLPGHAQNADAGLGRGLRVLIVEDESLVAMDMENALLEAHFVPVGIVDTQADAVAAAQRLRPDIILMDITLREGDGIAAARIIRDALAVCIIFVSGNSERRTLAADGGLAAGFIRKPFSADRFAGQVMEAFRRRR